MDVPISRPHLHIDRCTWLQRIVSRSDWGFLSNRYPCLADLSGVVLTKREACIAKAGRDWTKEKNNSVNSVFSNEVGGENTPALILSEVFDIKF